MEHSSGYVISWVTNKALVKKIEIVSSIFSDYNAMRLDINYRNKTVKNTNTWRLNNTLLNNQEITEEIKEEIKKNLETNDNENTMTENLWDATQAVLRGKFIEIQSFLKKQETSQINNLTLHLNQLEKEEQKTPKISRRKEIITIISEINGKEMQEMIAKINKTKSWFFEKTNKIDRPLARLIKKKKEKTQINRIRNEKGEVTTDTAEIQRIMRDYYKQLYANKMDNLEEMDNFLEMHNLPRLNQEEIENMNRRITNNEIETVVKNLPTNKSPGPDGFTGEFYQTLREELTPIFLKVFQNIAEGGTLPNSFYEATITLIPNQTKMSQRKKTTGQYH